jgi:hypothetical protein
MIKLFKKYRLKKLLSSKVNINSTEINQFIADLKRFDFSIIQTMGVISRKFKIGLDESRKIVLNSPSWIDEKDKFIEFNNKAWELMEQEADEVKENEDGTISLTFDLTKDDK